MSASTEPVASIVLTVLLMAALATRLGIEPPTIIAERQYRSALIARSYFFAHHPVPEWRRRVAAAAIAEQDRLEPPIFEALVARAYRLVGQERLRIATLFSAGFWLVGGVLFFLIAGRFARPGVALAVTAYYLFLPLAIEISAVFVPDSLMMMLFMAGLLMILRHHERPTTTRLLTAAFVSGAAILVKPLCMFGILAAFLALWLARALRSRSPDYGGAVVFLSVALAVGTTYYAYGIFLSDMLARKANKTFFPHLLLTRDFWRSWPATAIHALGVVPCLLALIGLPGLRREQPRELVYGLLAGHAAFLAVFAYHVRFAGYYHLVLLPAVGIAAIPVLEAVAVYLERAVERRVALAALVLASGLAFRAVLGELRAPGGAIEPPRVARVIGRIVGHSTGVVFVSPYYGTPLSYYGEMAGDFWRRAASDDGSPDPDGGPPDLHLRFAALDFEAEYLVVTDLHEFERHHGDLQAFADRECDLVAANDSYLIYRLEACAPSLQR
jgi:hypothetical protein